MVTTEKMVFSLVLRDLPDQLGRLAGLDLPVEPARLGAMVPRVLPARLGRPAARVRPGELDRLAGPDPLGELDLPGGLDLTARSLWGWMETMAQTGFSQALPDQREARDLREVLDRLGPQVAQVRLVPLALQAVRGRPAVPVLPVARGLRVELVLQVVRAPQAQQALPVLLSLRQVQMVTMARTDFCQVRLGLQELQGLLVLQAVPGRRAVPDRQEVLDLRAGRARLDQPGQRAPQDHHSPRAAW
jgi:hypothetical protein